MKRIIFALLLLCTVTTQAASFVTYESITVAAVAIGITASTVSPANQQQMQRCTFRLETAEIRYRYDGTAPTSAEGYLLEPLEILEIDSPQDALRIQFIRTGAVSGVLKGGCRR